MGKIVVSLGNMLQSFWTYAIIGAFALGMITGYILSTYF